LAFKRGIIGDPAGHLDSWQEGNQDCCRWRGVSCNNLQTGHVRELGLRNLMETFWFGVGLGFTVGLWAVFCTLLFNKPWRFAYFRLFARTHDRAHVFVFVTWARFTRKQTATNCVYRNSEHENCAWCLHHK
ncbi:hypothetical protein BAE44_0005572, partial [Dichanthelium oligosanthes]